MYLCSNNIVNEIKIYNCLDIKIYRSILFYYVLAIINFRVIEDLMWSTYVQVTGNVVV